MKPGPIETELEGLWREWVADRNRRGLRLMSVLVIVLYPVFWLLDWVMVDRSLVWTFAGLRLIGVVFCIGVLVVNRTAWGRAHHHELGIAFTGVVWATLLAMVWALGGPTSPYYAGLNLATLGTGILFLFGGRGAIAVYGSTVAAWLVMTAFSTGPGELPGALGNTLFIVSTAIVVVLNQFFLYGSFHSQVRANHALELTKVSLEKAHEDLKQLDQFKSEVFANITHELKTPLAMILAPLELILAGSMGTFPDSFRASMQSMYRSAMKLMKMIGDILMLTKLEESRLRLRIEETDLVGYLDGLVAQIRPLAERKELSVSFRSDAAKASLWVDLERIERVFVNLLSNAAKFTPEGGRLEVILEDQPDGLLVRVADTGPGFPPEMSTRIFDRFFQLDSSATRRHAGTGIGLALSKQLVELHGGQIWAESEVGKGATFFVRLKKGKDHFKPEALDRRRNRRPVSDGRREGDRGLNDWSLEHAGADDFRLLDIETATERRILERDPDEHSRLYTVLVVEDTREVIRIVHMTLRHEAKVMAAEDGLKGFELAVLHQPSLIVTDLMMPGIDGLELTRRLRADERTKHIPIIMLTARGDLEDRVAGLESGVAAYLTKPFSPKELLTTCRNLLDVQEKTADLLLTQRMNSLEAVAGGLAHEINNPLNYVKNALGIIKSTTDKIRALAEDAADRELTSAERTTLERFETRVAKMFSTAEAGVERIARTVDVMRSYAREGYARSARDYDAFEAVREVLAIVVPATGREVEVEVHLEGEGRVECVPEELNQVITNLVQNAIEAVEEGTGRVIVSGHREPDAVVLSVKDNGPGLSAENKARIFTPFFSTKGPGRGIGIGLTIVWRVVRALGGTIRVESQPGEGAEFIVRIPTQSGPLSAEAPRPEAHA